MVLISSYSSSLPVDPVCDVYYQPGPTRTGPLKQPNDAWLVLNSTVNTWTNYYQYDYYLSSTKLSKEDAETFCSDLDSDSTLVTINSVDENNFVFCLDSNLYERYIGMQMAYPSGRQSLTQVWADGSPVTFGETSYKGGNGHPWRKNEPNNYYGKEYCVMLGVGSLKKYNRPVSMWNDVNCVTKAQFVCKRTTSISNSVPDSPPTVTTVPITSAIPSTIAKRTQPTQPTTLPAPLPYCGSILYSVDQWVAMADTNFQFYTSSERVARAEASGVCASMNSGLASIHSVEENRFVFCQHTAITRWIGMDLAWAGHRKIEGQTWTDKTFVDFGKLNFARPYLHNTTIPWFKGQPDFYGHTEYCVLQGSVKGSKAVWSDVDCDSQHGYVCKKCVNGFEGPYCDIVLDYCSNNTCVFGDCVEQIPTADYSCTCKIGAGMSPKVYADNNDNLITQGIAADLGASVTREIPLATDAVWTIVGPDIVNGWWHERTDYPSWQDPSLVTRAASYLSVKPGVAGSVNFSYNFQLFDETEDFDFFFLYVEDGSSLNETKMLEDLDLDMPAYEIASKNNTSGNKMVSFTATSTLVWGVYTPDSVFGRAVASLQLIGNTPLGAQCESWSL